MIVLVIRPHLSVHLSFRQIETEELDALMIKLRKFFVSQSAIESSDYRKTDRNKNKDLMTLRLYVD